MHPRNPSKNELYQKYIKEGYYPEFARVKAENEFNERLVNIPFTMPAMVDKGFDSKGD